ncbi:hypothetical protein M407DRAFT_3868 [Tulasnella calospora MUT 4182]|uniref:F-box domain-containing protein n=1 Tax=Tulasnella calospora MUT 4182 TaxID=1051891 RepID=A0A0C3QLC6_9AGAM|nr:hypothetical protein M407DRAFT_3868 [Tulasnella calospora MUT 4182]
MHRLWLIPEIVSFILECLSRRDQAHMAQVCRLFWERAVPFIWRELPDIYMLVELFPPEKQSSGKGTNSDQANILKKSGEDELARDEVALLPRFSFYARFVRAISLTLDSYTYGDLKLLATRRPLTSSLKTLMVTIGDLDDAAQAELIPSTLYLPSLTTLQIYPMDADDDLDSCDSLAFLARAIPRTHFPKLESLSIEFPKQFAPAKD